MSFAADGMDGNGLKIWPLLFLRNSLASWKNHFNFIIMFFLFENHLV